MDPARIDKGLFGLTVTTSYKHPAVPLIRKLPRQYWIMTTEKSAQQQEYVLALAADILPTLRRIYRLPDVDFSPQAIAALADLGKQHRRASQHHRVEIKPDVSSALRGLPPSTDPFAKGAVGASTPLTTAAPSSENTP